jgi:pyruvate,water dikinase
VAGAARTATAACKGFAASPGVAEGPARVIFSADRSASSQEGEILVAPADRPELGADLRQDRRDRHRRRRHDGPRRDRLPRVRPAGRDRHRVRTKNVKTGQRLRVDGNTGTVQVLD